MKVYSFVHIISTQFGKLISAKYLRHFFIYFTSGSISRAIPFLVLLGITNYLTIEEFGLVSNFYVLVQLFSAVIGLKLMLSFQADFFSVEPRSRPALVTNIFFVQVGIAVVLGVLTYFFRAVIETQLKLPFQWVLAAALVAMSMNILDLRCNIFRLEEKPRNYSFFQVLNAALNAIFTIVFVVLLHFTWEGRIYSAIVAGCIMLIVCLIVLYKEQWISEPFSKTIAKQQLSYGFRLLPQALTPFLRKGVDKIALTSSYGLASNGLFSFAMNFGAIMNMFTDSLFSVVNPALYKFLSGNDNSEGSRMRIVTSTYFGFLGLAILLICCYFIFYFVTTNLFHPRYHGAVNYIPFILVEVFLQSLSRYFGSYLIFTKRVSTLSSSVFIIGVFHAVLAVLLIPSLHITGAFIALLSTEFLKAVVLIYLSGKHYPMPWWRIRQLIPR